MAQRRLTYLAGALVALGWALMTVGAFVRASQSGLGCPDWPACHGRLLAGGHPAMIEEVHRWIATLLIIGVLTLAFAVFRHYRAVRRITRPMVAVIGLLALQVVLGGVTVLLKNVSWTVVIHYGAAAILVAALALLAVRITFLRAGRPTRDAFTTAVTWFAGLSFVLLLLGSTVANTDSHTSCGRGFPLCNGTLVPTLNHHVVINLVHRTWAGAMLVLALWILWRSRRERARVPPVRHAASAVASLYLVQALVGIVVVAVGENTAIEIIHSSLASLTWAALATLLALTWTLPSAQVPHDHRGPERSGRRAAGSSAGDGEPATPPPAARPPRPPAPAHPA
jgi:cytochrome c oxidase assembly protein subunit 15